MRVLRLAVCSTALIIAGFAGQAAATCGVNGSISATETRPGQWTYTIDFHYFSYSPVDVLGRISVFLPQCELNCSTSMVAFPVTAGTLRGLSNSGQQCSVDVSGQFRCGGDPAINAPQVPTVIWMTGGAGNLCPATMPGTGRITFTVNIPPSSPREQVNAISTLSGTGQCWGTLSGRFPGCSIPVPTENMSWSGIKAARYTS